MSAECTTTCIGTDEAIAKRLFTSSPESLRQGTGSSERAPSPRDPLGDHYDIWGYKRDGHGARKKPRVGFCGAMIFFSMCVAAVVLTIQFNYTEWTALTSDDVYKFFSNEVLHQDSAHTPSLQMFYFNGKHCFGLGAFQLALSLGLFCAIFTCIFTFYDSDVPGNFPPTPVSPRRGGKGDEIQHTTRWHLGYIFVPINCFVAFSLSLFFFRWNIGLPLL